MSALGGRVVQDEVRKVGKGQSTKSQFALNFTVSAVGNLLRILSREVIWFMFWKAYSGLLGQEQQQRNQVRSYCNNTGGKRQLWGAGSGDGKKF